MQSVTGALVLALLSCVPAAGCTRKDAGNDAPAGPSFVKTAAAAIEQPPSPAGETKVEKAERTERFVGRWVPEPNNHGMRSGWSGTYVVGRFKGTAISARLKDEGANLFNVVIDGEVKKVLKTDKTKGEATYLLADDLTDAVHEIALHRRTEAKVGEAVFYGFETPGKLLPPASPPERRIETIGDSISTGYGNEGPNATCTYFNAEQNEYLTYAAIAARALSADHTTIAWSGKTVHEMDGYFDKALPARPDSPAWDFSKYEPQVVVINLGTNNFANIDPGEKLFVRVYMELATKVRRAYPRAFLVAALGPMLSDVYPENRRSLTQARKYMKTAVAKLKEGGERNIEMLEFPEQNHADGLGCGFHPSLKTHKLMGERLTHFIKEHVGW